MIAQPLAGWGRMIEVVESDAVRAELARLGAELVERNAVGGKPDFRVAPGLRHGVPDAAARRRVAARPDGGGRPRHLRVKFTGAGQGPKALVAEIVVGELGRMLGVAVPELALIEVDPEIGRREPDEEVQELVTASAGLNLAIDFLPGAVGYDRSFVCRARTPPGCSGWTPMSPTSTAAPATPTC